MSKLNGWSMGAMSLALTLNGVAASAAVIASDVSAPSDPIVGIASTPGSSTSTASTVGTVADANNYPGAESPANAIDNTNNKYLNFQKVNAGFITTLVANGPATLTGVRFKAGNDSPERDPLTITIEGTNSPNPTTTLNSAWSPIYSGVTGLATDPGRDTAGPTTGFTPTTAGGFTSYRVLVTGVRDAAAANSFQFDELDMIGSTVPEPTMLAGAGLVMLLSLRRRR
ncbi:MAG: hypothetical protein JWN40_2730 [Phycisphaerales bacterium]|jgi:hypothetical protein|nr:hypothetical protein [Phycisphaerales bacterium]